MKFGKLKAKLDDYIEKEGLRHSSQREEVLRTLWQSDKHLSADELYEIVKDKIGIATVYRSLNLFTDCGICNEIYFTNENTRYEISYGKKHHDHLICEKCGKYIEVRNDKIENLQKKIAKENNFVLKSHKMDLYGICEECQK